MMHTDKNVTNAIVSTNLVALEEIGKFNLLYHVKPTK